MHRLFKSGSWIVYKNLDIKVYISQKRYTHCLWYDKDDNMHEMQILNKKLISENLPYLN